MGDDVRNLRVQSIVKSILVYGVILGSGWGLGCTGGGISSSEPIWEDTPNLCRDGVDNDDDGKVDCADPDCRDVYVCTAADGGDMDSETETGIGPVPEEIWARIISNNLEFGEDDGDPTLAPAHMVLVRTFEIMRTEVTVAMYQECVEAGACAALSDDTYCASEAYTAIVESDPERYPMNCVSWYQASDFCAWFDARLPSEKEWEKAARGNSDNLYPWGDDEPSCALAVIDDGIESDTGCGLGHPAPVCSKGTMWFQMCDVVGNVAEWMEDDMHPSYEGSPPNGVAWIDEPRGEGRMVRGGAYYDPPGITSRTRMWCVPDEGCDISDEMDGYGFRCAR